MVHNRFRFVSSVDVPMVVDAPDWRSALCMGLQLLEREDAVARIELERTPWGVSAVDPKTGASFAVSWTEQQVVLAA